MADSLGGDSKCLMFVCANPSPDNAPESLCSLTFAARVRNTELGQAKKNVSKSEIAASKAANKKLEENQREVIAQKSAERKMKAAKAKKKAADDAKAVRSGDDAVIAKLFQRYDIDASGTMNTSDEFHALTLNLLFKLKARQPTPMLTEPQLAKVVKKVGRIDDTNAWGVDKYCEWFKKEFPAR